MLENVSLAQQSVIERILPLLEEKPTLAVYEYSSTCNLTIHEDFRIFLSTDASRKSGWLLSQALLNRVVLQRTSPLDEGLNESDLNKSDLSCIVQHQLSHMPSSHCLSFLMASLHLEILKKGDMEISIKNVLNAVDLANVHYRNGMQAVMAVAMGLHEAYCHTAGSLNHEDAQFVTNLIHRVIGKMLIHKYGRAQRVDDCFALQMTSNI